ncbi:2,4-dienoyl- reductase precursor [Fusarium longipes]|uniref:enoyl-[acyl-carrier-protein] reductase n=1 Tax=Fusarium longipes TaxID=694270 RepID=A0A395T9J2_9HYPO|nr:2,4-dienoyl- reductase precursor [Fusarium longipes]
MVIITQIKPAADAEASVAFHYPDKTENKTEIGPDDVLVSFLRSPINPQDLLVIAGKYPVKPSYTQEDQPVLGYDGVARVEAVGPIQPSSSGTTSARLQPGDLVIPRRHGLGTWRSQAILSQSDVIRLSPTEDLIGASLLRMAFLPAYLLVQDMRELKPGDWIVQNAGSSTIARLVAQFAKLKGVHTCSVVRGRSENALESLKQELRNEGADMVITQTELAEKGSAAHPALADAATQGRIVLALDAVFGEPGQQLAQVLSHGGTYVNYGSLGGSNATLALSQRLLFWSEVKFRNFRLSEQLNKRTQSEQESLLLWFQELLARKLVQTPKVQTIRVPTESSSRAEFEKHVKEAIAVAKSDKVGSVKQVLEFSG